MTITTKNIDLSKENLDEQSWAESSNNVYMNMLGACRYDEKDGTYKMAPIKYSDVNLTGETIRFGNGQSFNVVYSCLATEYKNNKEIYNEWWKKAREIVNNYKEQCQIEEHVKSTNTSLKKLRQENNLMSKEDIDNAK